MLIAISLLLSGESTWLLSEYQHKNPAGTLMTFSILAGFCGLGSPINQRRWDGKQITPQHPFRDGLICLSPLKTIYLWEEPVSTSVFALECPQGTIMLFDNSSNFIPDKEKKTYLYSSWYILVCLISKTFSTCLQGLTTQKSKHNWGKGKGLLHLNHENCYHLVVHSVY